MIMKVRSLCSLITSLAILGVGASTKPQSAIAEPAPIFRPILRDIQNQLPRGWVMRLPSSVNISDTPLYPQVITRISGEFAVWLNSQPNCGARACQFGIITVAQNSEYDNNLRSKPIFTLKELERVNEIRRRGYETWTESDKRELIRSEMAVLERTPITLQPGIEGLFIVQNSGGASTPPSLSVIRKQDGLNYRVSIRGGFDRQRNIVSQRDKSELINLAISMAKESPIKGLLLLQEQGVLASGDSVLPSDNSLYDQYTFQGSAGQTVTITVESAEFDTYVAIITPDEKLLAENDDINQSNKNSGLTATLPRNGTYRVIVNGYDNNSRGGYAVSVSTPTHQTVTGQSPSPNQQTATRTIQPVIQTFSSVKSLGMAQFLRGTTELKSAQETLQKAARGEYDTITNGQKTDFIEDILEDIPEIRPVDCKSFGFSCESTEITYADYLNLKLKVYLQVGVFKNGMKVYDEIPKYQNRLFQDRQYGGLNVGQNLTSEWDKRWNNVKEQQRLKDEQANLPITERLGVVMEQTVKDTANFSGELFKTSTKVAATLAQIKDLAETITSLRSINQDNLNRIAGGPKYYLAVEKILKDSGKALQSFDTDKINELALKGAQETIELINAQDRKVAGSANVIKIYSAAKDIIDKNNLLRQPQATNALDDFDKFYIAATMYSKAVEVIIGGLSIPFSEAKVVDTLLKKADAVNTVLFDALEFTYKDSVRRQYVRLQYAYNRNQIQVVGLSSFIDYAAEEVGQYLLKARPDIVTRRPDGTIAVSVDGVVYPP